MVIWIVFVSAALPNLFLFIQSLWTTTTGSITLSYSGKLIKLMPRVLYMQNKYSTTELSLQSFICDPESHYVAKADLELKILLPLPLKWWDYGYAPPHMANLRSIDEKLSFHEES